MRRPCVHEFSFAVYVCLLIINVLVHKYTQCICVVIAPVCECVWVC